MLLLGSQVDFQPLSCLLPARPVDGFEIFLQKVNSTISLGVDAGLASTPQLSGQDIHMSRAKFILPPLSSKLEA